MADDPLDPEPPDDTSDAPPADPVQAGLEQFQRAALEAIRAGRAMLDAAETMIQEPGAAEQLVRTVGSVARTATEAVSGFAAGHWSAPDQDADESASDGSEDDPPEGFQRISVD
jgi:hypothetical protein